MFLIETFLDELWWIHVPSHGHGTINVNQGMDKQGFVTDYDLLGSNTWNYAGADDALGIKTRVRVCPEYCGSTRFFRTFMNCATDNGTITIL